VKFARLIQGELQTENVNVIILTVAELRRLQALPHKAHVAELDGLTLYVTPTPDSPVLTHTPIESK
jgi:hypothetical protein